MCAKFAAKMSGTPERCSFLGLVCTDEFNLHTKDDICRLFSSNFLAVRSEVEVFMAALRWLLYDWPSRRDNVIEVMGCVRFGFMSPWQLVNLQRNIDNLEVSTVAKFPEVRNMIDRGMEYAVIRCHFGHSPHEFRSWVERLQLQDNAQREYSGEGGGAFTSYRQFLEELDRVRDEDEQHGQLKLFHQLPQPRNMLTIPPSIGSV